LIIYESRVDEVIENYMELMVKEIYHDLLKSYPSFCNCETCQEDVLCMALNELPAMYNTTSTGLVYAKLTEMQPQFKVQAIQAVSRAIEKVQASPRHTCN